MNLLSDAKLARAGRGLGAIVRAVTDYVKSIRVEGTLGFDSLSGTPTVTGKISLGEPSAEQRKLGVRSVDELVALADEAWSQSRFSVWLVLDRLDVAFADDSELEENALRALFKTYLDFTDKKAFRLKIFLRSDIWSRLTSKGFREASHITRQTTIQWDKPSLLNLIVSRTLGNEIVRDTYGIGALPTTYAEREQFFQRAFPDQIDPGSRKLDTIDWILARTRDGSGVSAPREIIHLITAARDSQIRQLENGEKDDAEYLIGRSAFKSGLQEVSRVRLEQTLYAEYPSLQERMAQLEGEKAEQRPETLAKIWGVESDAARKIASALVDIGFFELRGTKEEPIYWVPFLYRDALGLVQGAATVDESREA